MRIHLLGATGLHQPSRQSLHSKIIVNPHSNSTSGRQCVEANMTPKLWLYRKTQNNPFLQGAAGLGILSAALLQGAGILPRLPSISKCWTHRHRGVKGQGTLSFVFLKETASDPLFLCLASEDTLEQRGAGMSSVAGKGHMQ